MIIIDEKEMYQRDIEKLTRYRRYEVPKVRRLNRIVEFSYPVDSEHHPLVQLSDLIIYLTRKFLEYENGYREASARSPQLLRILLRQDHRASVVEDTH